MKAQDLKNSILQLAIQGKLVEQDSTDEPAEELYKKIQAEKQRLIKEGKIKKDKPLAPITEDEIPFDIPDTWKWVRLGEIFAHNTGKALNSADRNGILKPYITTSNLYWNSFVFDKSHEMYFSNEEIDKCSVKKGDLLVCEGGDFGRAAVWNYDYDMCIQNHIHRLRPYIKLDILFFYFIFLFYKLANKIGGKGIGIQGLSSGALHNIAIPLPPLAEQRRIVDKIKELEPFVEQYDKAEKELTLLNDTFPEQLKKSVLQYAIQGKLVEQDPADEPAEELYKKIQAEKQRLIKEGKIKKDKHESLIFKRDNRHYEKIGTEVKDITDEIPFDIPDTWKWVRLGEIIVLTSGRDLTPNCYSASSQKGIPYITDASCLNNGDVLINRWTTAPSVLARQGCLLLTCKGTVGEMAFLKIKEAHIARQIMSLDISNFMQKTYIAHCIKCHIQLLQSKAKSMIPGISRNDVLNLFIPLPPLGEQKRIVDKIKEIERLIEQ